MATNLLSIPAELLASIADELEVDDYGSLRLCCKQAEEFTFPSFAQKFFSRKKFFRAHSSLSTFLSISESRLGPYLETFVLCSVLLDKDPPEDAGHVSRGPYFQAHADQTSMLASGWDRDILTAAFKNLPDIKAIAVENFDDFEYWDFETGQMNNKADGGYSLKTLLANLGFEPGRPPRQASAAYQWIVSIQTLLAAVAKAGVRPKTLSITGKNIKGISFYVDASGVYDDAFNIPPFMRQMMLPVIEGFEELDLDVHSRSVNPPLEPCKTSHLRDFIGIPRRLQKLRIRNLLGGQQSPEPVERGDGFWAWLGADHKGKDKAPADQQDADGSGSSDTNTVVSPPPIALPHLRELELCNEDILLEDLTCLLNKVSPTLRKLSLHDLILRDRNSEDPVDNQVDVKVEVDLWASFCGKLAALPCENLFEVNISGFGGLGNWHLHQFADGTALPDSVHFNVLRMTGDAPFSAQAEFSYKGPDVGGALRRLADDLRAAMRDGRHVFSAEPVQRRLSF